MKRLQELYQEVYQCRRNHENKLSNKNLAIAMLTAAKYIEDGRFGDGSNFVNHDMNIFWAEMEGNWANLDSTDRERIVKALRWGAKDFNGNHDWLEAIDIMDDIDLYFDKERQACILSCISSIKK